MSGSNCCFLTGIQVSQEADKVAWYSHLFKNFLQFVLIHTIKGSGVVNEAEVDVFLECGIYNGILLNHKKEWNMTICSMGRPKDYHTKQSKSEK